MKPTFNTPAALAALVNKGIATHTELAPFIQLEMNKGRYHNEFGLLEIVIYDSFNNIWHYSEEDGVFYLESFE